MQPFWLSWRHTTYSIFADPVCRVGTVGVRFLITIQTNTMNPLLGLREGTPARWHTATGSISLRNSVIERRSMTRFFLAPHRRIRCLESRLDCWLLFCWWPLLERHLH